MDKKQKANLLRSRAMMGNQNARKKRATEPDVNGVTTAASATAPTSTDAPTHNHPTPDQDAYWYHPRKWWHEQLVAVTQETRYEWEAGCPACKAENGVADDRVSVVHPRYVAPLPDRCPVIAIGGGGWARCEREQDHEGNHDAVVWFPV